MLLSDKRCSSMPRVLKVLRISCWLVIMRLIVWFFYLKSFWMASLEFLRFLLVFMIASYYYNSSKVYCREYCILSSPNYFWLSIFYSPLLSKLHFDLILYLKWFFLFCFFDVFKYFCMMKKGKGLKFWRLLIKSGYYIFSGNLVNYSLALI